MPTPKPSDTPTKTQIRHLVQLAVAERQHIVVHASTIPYRQRVGMNRRGWITGVWSPRKGVHVDPHEMPVLVLTERGRALILNFTQTLDSYSKTIALFAAMVT